MNIVDEQHYYLLLHCIITEHSAYTSRSCSSIKRFLFLIKVLITSKTLILSSYDSCSSPWIKIFYSWVLLFNMSAGSIVTRLDSICSLGVAWALHSRKKCSELSASSSLQDRQCGWSIMLYVNNWWFNLLKPSLIWVWAREARPEELEYTFISKLLLCLSYDLNVFKDLLVLIDSSREFHIRNVE